jgi:phage terminase large subunit-like protein
VRELKLDITDLNDRQLLQFETVVFSRVIDHYEKLAQDQNHKWTWWDTAWAAEALMKAYDACEMWRRSSGEEARYWLIEFLRRLASALLKELKR